ncbi:hypothetical protein C2S51_002082 [Perilla frutescens var. frutescens]|nr:hypothetical protein C2S51_002082 [Perilla frutescens var. frutescens]
MTLIDYNPWGEKEESGMKSPPHRLGGPSSKLSSRMSDRFDRTKEKTKEAAKKVKTGASTSVNWVKVKCNQTKLFPKK